MPPSLRETVMWTVFQDEVLSYIYIYIYVASTSAWLVHQTSELSVESVYYQLHWYLFITSDVELRNMFCLDS